MLLSLFQLNIEESIPPVVYPTVLDDIVPEYESGFDFFYDFNPTSSAFNTINLEDDGTYTVTGSVEAGEYFEVSVFDYSTGIEHVMSPYRVYIDGDIRIGDYTGDAADTAETALEGLGLTVSRTYSYSVSDVSGLVLSQDPPAYALLTDSTPVTLTVSLGSPVKKILFTVRNSRIRFHANH